MNADFLSGDCWIRGLMSAARPSRHNDVHRTLFHALLSVFVRDQNFFLFGRFGAEFQNFAGLAFERLANGFERGETDGPGLAGLEDGQVLRRDVHGLGQIVQPHFALGKNHVQIDDDGHV
jgi:hypothetical protein